MSNGETEQHDIFHLLPGVAGGRALRDQRGNEYFAYLARRGAAMRSQEVRRAISKKGANEARRRLYTTPRSLTYEVLGHRVTERIVPYWPHQKERLRNRKRPIFVYIETDREILDKE